MAYFDMKMLLSPMVFYSSLMKFSSDHFPQLLHTSDHFGLHFETHVVLAVDSSLVLFGIFSSNTSKLPPPIVQHKWHPKPSRQSPQ